MVAGNVLLAAIAHAALLPLFFFPKSNPQDTEKMEDDEPNLLCFAVSTVAACALFVILSLLASRSGHAPFPRVFLVFCLPLTAAVLAFAKTRGIHQSFTFAQQPTDVPFLPDPAPADRNWAGGAHVPRSFITEAGSATLWATVLNGVSGNRLHCAALSLGRQC